VWLCKFSINLPYFADNFCLGRSSLKYTALSIGETRRGPHEDSYPIGASEDDAYL